MYSIAELLELYHMPLEELEAMSRKLIVSEVEFCSLISIKTGKCSENCKYCAQSSHYSTGVKSHEMLDISEVKKAAIDSINSLASRFAIVSSGFGPREEDMDKICEMISVINETNDERGASLFSCASLGILNELQVKRLKESGLKRYHHNIETAKSYFPNICTTHTFEQRLKTIEMLKKYDIEVCCGGIIGLGETVEQRMEMIEQISHIEPQSIPMNILSPIKGTVYENNFDKISQEDILKTLNICKIANPRSKVRFAGGRNLRLEKENQIRSFKTCVESTIIGNYLTTTGIDPKEDIKLMKELDKKICMNI